MILQPTRRRGAAPIELVMTLPFLLIIGLVLLFVTRGVLLKSAAATEARRSAFARRAEAVPEQPMALIAPNPLDGLMTGDVTSQLKGGRLLGDVTVSSHSAVTAGTWDYNSLLFQSDTLPFIPHLQPMGLIMTNGRVNASGLSEYTSLTGLGQATTMFNQYLWATNLLGGVINFFAPFSKALMLTELPATTKILDGNLAAAKGFGDTGSVTRIEKQLQILTKGQSAFKALDKGGKFR